MALIIGGGINIGGQITISTSGTTGNVLFEYIMGNSASYNGQGIDLARNAFVGPYGNTAGTNYIFDISADYGNGAYGNIGTYFNDNSNITRFDNIFA